MKKEMKKGKLFSLLALAIIFTLATVGQAKAQVTYNFGYDSMFNAPKYGGVAPTGPWATATFTDVSPDNVQLTLNVTNNITAAESFGEFFFNYTGDATNLNITAINDSAVSAWSADINDPSTTADDFPLFQADGDGIYDLLFDLPPPPGGRTLDKFTAGETLTYNISYTGVSASDFYDLAAIGGPNGPFYAAARLQGIPCTTDTEDPDYANCWNSENMGTTSAWASGTPTVVPEPISSTLFIVGGATLGFRRFRKKFKK